MLNEQKNNQEQSFISMLASSLNKLSSILTEQPQNKEPESPFHYDLEERLIGSPEGTEDYTAIFIPPSQKSEPQMTPPKAEVEKSQDEVKIDILDSFVPDIMR